jgi:hypothetical protein
MLRARTSALFKFSFRLLSFLVIIPIAGYFESQHLIFHFIEKAVQFDFRIQLALSLNLRTI